MDTLCTTDCGAVYTNAILAARLGCAEGSSPNPTPAGGGGGAAVNTANGPVSNTARAPEKGKAAGAGDKAAADKPTYPQDYPGLRMGCVKDKKDNSYCAVKRAALTVPGGKAAVCDFYFSWCVRAAVSVWVLGHRVSSAK